MRKFLSIIGILGARRVGNLNDLVILRLNRNTSFGLRNNELYIPYDNVIFKEVSYFGRWFDQIVYFFEQATKTKGHILYLDIGANIGITVLQVFKNKSQDCNITCYAFEPVPSHFLALQLNTQKYSSKINYCNFALGNFEGKSKIYIEEKNRGNASVYLEQVPVLNRLELEIDMRKTDWFFNFDFYEYDRIFLKMDVQGAELSIISLLPDDLVNKISHANIELSQNMKLNETEIEKFNSFLMKFKHLSWDPLEKTITNPSEIIEFVQGRNAKQRDLFLKANNS